MTRAPWRRPGLLMGFVLCAAVVCTSGTSGRGVTAEPQSQSSDELARVVAEACGQEMVLLGEEGHHRSGRTTEFKVALVRQLVERCGHTVVLFESPVYDFITVQQTVRGGKQVDARSLSAAIGGIWTTREFEPLVPFLLERVNAGKLDLFGIDDQFGRDAIYAKHDLARDLTGYLDESTAPRCLGVLQRHTLWQYTDDRPYADADRSMILTCLDQIDAAIAARTPAKRSWIGGHAQMARNVRRQVARDTFGPMDDAARVAAFNARDESMFQNMTWAVDQYERAPKVIVWSATVHVARFLPATPGRPARVPMGLLLRRSAGARPFVLGFSALSGQHASFSGEPQAIPVAPPGSIEHEAFRTGESNVRYLDSRELSRLGARPGRPFRYEQSDTVNWADLLDGLVVFREEQPSRR